MFAQQAVRHAAQAAADQRASGVSQRVAAMRGNQATLRSDAQLSSGRAQGLPAGLQAKLAIGAINDPLEAEADRIADGIIGDRPAPCCTRCADGDRARRKMGGDVASSAVTPSGAAAAQAAIAGGGQPLSSPLRDYFEPRLGHDLRDVRIFAERAGVDAIGARAFTLGSRIAFAPGQYRPETPAGRWLLAHELAHVAQQRDGAAAILRRDPLTVEEIRAQIAELERRAAEPVSVSDEELAAQVAERNRLLAQLREAMVSTRSTPVARPTVPPRATTPPPSPEPLASYEAVSPQEMTDLLIEQRGFGAAQPTAEGGVAPMSDAALAPTARGQALGPGYETNAVIQVVDAEGNQIAFEMARYGGGGEPHAEAQALSRLRMRLIGRSVRGGKLIVAVDQLACGGCLERLRTFAVEQGLAAFEVWVPGRAAGDGRAGPKWTARSAASRPARGTPVTSEGGYRVQAVQAQGESLPVPPQPRVSVPEGGGAAALEMPVVAEPVATPVAEAGPQASVEPVVEPVVESVAEPGAAPRRGGGGSGVGGALLGFALPLVAAFIHGGAVRRRVREQAETQGYVPEDAPSGEGLFYDLGAFLIDPGRDAERAVGIEDRFNVVAWRANIRALAARVPVGGSFSMRWDIGLCSFDMFHRQRIEHRTVTYRREANGTWTTTGGEGTVSLELILGSASDATVRAAVMSDPCEA